MYKLHDFVMRNKHGPSRSSPIPGRSGYEGELWLERHDEGCINRRGEIKYYPETDSFYVPHGKGGPRDVPARDWLRHYGEGDFWEERERQLEELEFTGRISGRETDRWGNSWEGDQFPGGHHGSRHGGSRYRSDHGSRFGGSHHGSVHGSHYGEPNHESGQGSRHGGSHYGSDRRMPPGSRHLNPFEDVPREPSDIRLPSQAGSRRSSRYGSRSPSHHSRPPSRHSSRASGSLHGGRRPSRLPEIISEASEPDTLVTY